MRSRLFTRSPLRFLLLIFFAFVALSWTERANAVPYYFEFGGTVASLSNPSPLFQTDGKAASSSASSTMGIPMTFGVHLQESQKGLLFSLALQNRYLMGQTGAGESFTVMTTGPVFRAEFWKLVLGVGYTPIVWRGLTLSRNLWVDSVMTIEAQFLFPITPEIDFGLQASRQTFKTTLGTGPNPSTEFGAFFRLNFGMTDAVLTERKKFKGWRYPFGSPKR